jgi:hypothetical protein
MLFQSCTVRRNTSWLCVLSFSRRISGQLTQGNDAYASNASRLYISQAWLQTRPRLSDAIVCFCRFLSGACLLLYICFCTFIITIIIVDNFVLVMLS